MDSFLPEEIYMPAGSPIRSFLYHHELPAGPKGSWGTPSRYLDDVLGYLHLSLGMPNPQETSLPLQIFQAIRRKFVGLSFSDELASRLSFTAAVVHWEVMAAIYADEWGNHVEEYARC